MGKKKLIDELVCGSCGVNIPRLMEHVLVCNFESRKPGDRRFDIAATVSFDYRSNYLINP